MGDGGGELEPSQNLWGSGVLVLAGKPADLGSGDLGEVRKGGVCFPSFWASGLGLLPAGLSKPCKAHPIEYGKIIPHFSPYSIE